MKKIIRMSLYIILGSFIFIQFFRVEMNTAEEVPATDFITASTDMPEELKELFKNSCYDCHSNNTN